MFGILIMKFYVCLLTQPCMWVFLYLSDRPFTLECGSWRRKR